MQGRLKSHFRTGKFAGVLKDSAPTVMVSTPDVDNVAKFYLDALNGKAFIEANRATGATKR